jgi:xanthosine utilization system XapX-like protein
LISGSSLAAAWRQAQCAPHIFGLLPGRQADAQTDALALMPDVAKEKRS